MIVYKCDLCDQIRECVQKKIQGKHYDICLECWNPLEAKLKGKGRTTPAKVPFEVYLPPMTKADAADDKEKPFPGAPPETWLREDTVN